MKYVLYKSDAAPLTVGFMQPYAIETSYFLRQYDNHTMFASESKLDSILINWVCVDSATRIAYMLVRSSKTQLYYLWRLNGITKSAEATYLHFQIDPSSSSYFQLQPKDRDWKIRIACDKYSENLTKFQYDINPEYKPSTEEEARKAAFIYAQTYNSNFLREVLDTPVLRSAVIPDNSDWYTNL